MLSGYALDKWARVNCNLCGSSQSRLLFVDRLSWNDEELQFRLVECTQCGLWYVNPRNLTAAGRFYCDGVSADQLEQWCKEQGEWKFSVFDKYLSYADNYLRIRRIGERRLLDIGCGVGWFLNYAQKRGYQVRGVESSTPEAVFAQRRFGVDVYTGVVETIPYPDGYFQVVTLNDVLEHLTDPVGTLKVVRSKLQPGGLVMLRSANGRFALLKARVLSKLFPHKQYLLHSNEHLFQFTSQTMIKILDKAGFTTLKMDNGRPDYVPDFFRHTTRNSWYVFSLAVQMVNPAAYLCNSLDVFAVRKD